MSVEFARKMLVPSNFHPDKDRFFYNSSDSNTECELELHKFEAEDENGATDPSLTETVMEMLV